MIKTTYTKLSVILTLLAVTMIVPASATPYYIYKAQSDTIDVYDEEDDDAEIVHLDEDEFPMRYRDRDQNRHEDGTESATVARYKRGGFFLVQDSLFVRSAKMKRYPNKRFLDKAMFDIGGTVLWGKARDRAGFYSMGAGSEGRLNLGDWITPDHGWRVGLTVGVLPIVTNGYTPELRHSYNLMQYGARADYMLNLTAVSHRRYYRATPVEFYGVAGIDLGMVEFRNSNDEHTTASNVGAHVGLKTVYNFGSHYFAYVEPELRVYRPSQLLYYQAADKYALGFGLTAGIGVRNNPFGTFESQVRDSISAFGDDWFMQVAGGSAFPLDRIASTAPRFNVAMGKWLNLTSGFRAGFSAAAHRLYPEEMRTVTLGAQVDYMLNLTRTLTTNPSFDRTREHRFNVVYLLGVGYNFSERSRLMRTRAFSAGTGFQLNYRVAPMTYVYLEPRIDFYQQNYLADFPKSDPEKNNNVITLLAGFSFHQGMHTRELRDRNDDFKLNSWFDRLFIQAAGGVQAPLSTHFIRPTRRYEMLKQRTQVAIGKWLTATHGVRFLAEEGSIKQRHDLKLVHMGIVGAQYLWNITNALAGYRSDRLVEVVGALGGGAAWTTGAANVVHPVAAAGLQVHFSLTPQWSLFAEPQLRFYDKTFMPAAGTKVDALASIMMGAQLRTPGVDQYRLAREASLSTRRSFYGLAGAFSMPMHRSVSAYSCVGRFSAGRWVTPSGAYRISMLIQGYPTFFATHQQRHIRPMIGADYVFDILNLAYGYDGQRVFALRPLAGGNVGLGLNNAHYAAVEGDVHIGVQGAFRVGRTVEIYAEPQIMYSFFEGGSRSYHITPTFYVGVNRTIKSLAEAVNHMYHRVQGYRSRNEEAFHWTDERKIYNRLFFELGAGPQLLWSRAALSDLRHYMGYGVYMGLGRWFTPQNGIRFNLNGGLMTRPGDEDFARSETMGFGIEYAQSISNAIWKYNPDRLFDFNAYVGPYFQFFRKMDRPKMGINIGLQPVININHLYSLFLQHDLTAYRKLRLYSTTSRYTVTNNVMLGLQVHPDNYDRAESCRIFDEGDKHAFFSVAGGMASPFRQLKTNHKPFGGAGRLSYGRWFQPASAWRVNIEGRSYAQSNRNNHQSTEVLLGADYLFDITTLAKGYSYDNRFIMRVLVGANVGTYYQAKSKGSLNFLADAHTGAQIGVLAGKNTEIYIEPTVRYNVAGNISGSRLYNAFSHVMLGVSQRILSNIEPIVKDEEDEDLKNNFATGALGVGRHTYTQSGLLARRKFLGVADFTYGHWFGPLSGVRVGVSNDYSRTSPDHNSKDYRDELSLHADYMLNLLSFFSGTDTRDRRAEFAAYAGLNYTLAFATGQDMRKGLGGEAGLQVGYKITPFLGLFLEPSVTIHGTRLSDNVSHGLDGDGRVLLGVKYAF
ncbi:MAG: hypothetical protein MJZ40_03660 [Bacteroidaceae bacterium]|nr:hypothetical protein [Bacteroidaceae bacterium]